RVPGLRREEIAELAGVSTAYYTRIERGDLRGVSDSVLESLARALRLDRAERAHLQDLARAAAGRSGLPEGGEGTGDQGPVVPPRVHQLIETMGDVPVIAGNHLRDSLAANALGRALFPDLFPEDGPALNTAEYMFLDERARRFYPDWETTARNAVSNLRLTAGRRPGDPDLRALIERLRAGSSEFRTWWDGHTVRVHDHGTKTIDHPQVGRLTLSYEVLDIPSVPGVPWPATWPSPGLPMPMPWTCCATWCRTPGRGRWPTSRSTADGTGGGEAPRRGIPTGTPTSPVPGATVESCPLSL